MWSNRGDFVERGFLSERRRSAASLRPGMRLSLAKPSLPNASAKLLLFFDMAMGWFGLRAVLVRIACMCPHDWAKCKKKSRKKQGVTEITFLTFVFYVKVTVIPPVTPCFFLFSAEAIYIGVYYI